MKAEDFNKNDKHMRQFTEKQMCDYIKERIETITSPVAYQYGFENNESVYHKLCELQSLSTAFCLGMSEEIAKVTELYIERLKAEYEKTKRLYSK